MTLVNALTELDNNHVIETHYCVVGSGVAAITLALKLSATGREVTMIEAGGKNSSQDSQAFFAGNIANYHSNAPLHRYRQRRLGGTSVAWGGRCIPFDPIDFERRSYIPNSGWPIDYSEISKYFSEAMELCEAGSANFSLPNGALLGNHTLFSHTNAESVLMERLEKWSPPTNFWRRYSGILRKEENVKIIYNAPCTGIFFSEGGENVSSIQCQVTSRKRIKVAGNIFILACGGAENPRLLLSSNRQRTSGIGNSYDNVGRYYMSHLNGIVSKIKLYRPPKEIFNKYIKDQNGVYIRRYLALKSSVLNSECIPNFSARLHFENISDYSHGSAILSAIYIAKNFRSIAERIPIDLESDTSNKMRSLCALHFPHIMNIIQDSPSLVKFLPHFLAHRFLGRRRIPSIIMDRKSGIYPLLHQAEQSPDPDSRIVLGTDLDKNGIPRIELRFRTREEDFVGIYKALKLINKQLQTAKFGCVEFFSGDIFSEMRRQVQPVQGHFIGTTRMSNSEKVGVVNSDCLVFSTSNLYLAGSSVFPTNGAANPTLTIVALTLRLAEHLMKRSIY